MRNPSMRKRLPRCAHALLSTILLAAPSIALAAEDPANPQTGVAAPYGGIGLSFGSTGFGVDYRYGLSRFVDLRAGYQFGTYSHSFDQDGNHYDGKLQIHAATLMADLKPFAGGFRISGGLYTGSPAIKLKAHGINQYELGDATYNGDLKIDGGIDLGNTAPYLGLGWGGTSNGRGFGVSFDIGVMFTHSPAVTLNALGRACDASSNQLCDPNGADSFDISSSDPRAATFQQNRVKEIAKIEDNAKNYQYWPVLNLGLVYRF